MQALMVGALVLVAVYFGFSLYYLLWRRSVLTEMLQLQPPGKIERIGFFLAMAVMLAWALLTIPLRRITVWRVVRRLERINRGR